MPLLRSSDLGLNLAKCCFGCKRVTSFSLDFKLVAHPPPVLDFVVLQNRKFSTSFHRDDYRKTLGLLDPPLPIVSSGFECWQVLYCLQMSYGFELGFLTHAPPHTLFGAWLCSSLKPEFSCYFLSYLDDFFSKLVAIRAVLTDIPLALGLDFAKPCIVVKWITVLNEGFELKA